MITTFSTQPLSYGTDPVASAVRAGQQSAAIRHAERSEAAPAGGGHPLDLERLYPALYAEPQRPAVNSLTRPVAKLSVPNA